MGSMRLKHEPLQRETMIEPARQDSDLLSQRDLNLDRSDYHNVPARDWLQRDARTRLPTRL